MSGGRSGRWSPAPPDSWEYQPPVQECASKTFCSSASALGANASFLRWRALDDRRPRLPNSIGDSLLPSLDFARPPRWTRDRVRSWRASLGRPAAGIENSQGSQIEPARRDSAAKGSHLPQQFRPAIDPNSTQSDSSSRRKSRSHVLFGSTGLTLIPDTFGETGPRRVSRCAAAGLTAPFPVRLADG